MVQVRKMTPLDETIPDNDENQQFNMAFKMNNQQIFEYNGATPSWKSLYINMQQLNWLAHITRSSNLTYIKKLTFTDEKNKRLGQPLNTLRRSVIIDGSVITNGTITNFESLLYTNC